jgi:hypothetical protein
VPSRHHAVLDALNQIVEDLTAIPRLEKGSRSLSSKTVVRGIQPGIRIQDDLRDIGQQGVVFIRGLRSGVSCHDVKNSRS